MSSALPRYIPKKLAGNVNVTYKHPLIELGLLLLGLFFAFSILYVFIGVVADYTVPYLPISIEESIGESVVRAISESNNYSAQDSYQQRSYRALLERMLQKISKEELENRGLKYKLIYIENDNIVNACAVP